MKFSDLAACDRALTVPEVAKLLNIHRLSLYRMIKQNRIPGVFRIGAAVRINPQKLAEFIKELPTVSKGCHPSLRKKAREAMSEFEREYPW